MLWHPRPQSDTHRVFRKKELKEVRSCTYT